MVIARHFIGLPELESDQESGERRANDHDPDSDDL
jgi:hypothetical protein